MSLFEFDQDLTDDHISIALRLECDASHIPKLFHKYCFYYSQRDFYSDDWPKMWERWVQRDMEWNPSLRYEKSK